MMSGEEMHAGMVRVWRMTGINDLSVDLYEDNIGRVDYVNHMGDDLTIVNAARVSFGKQKDKFDDRDRKLISYLVKHRHTSTLEHTCFLINDLPIINPIIYVKI